MSGLDAKALDRLRLRDGEGAITFAILAVAEAIREAGWSSLPPQDLSTIHHACRMYAMYPGLSECDKREAVRVADVSWEEVVRRASES